MARKPRARSNGEGTIYKKGDRYYAQVTITAYGKSNRKTVSSTSYEECRRKLNDLIHQRDHGKLANDISRMSVGQLAMHYYLNVKKHKDGPDDRKAGIANSTWNWHVDLTRWYIADQLDEVKLSKFTKDRAQTYFDDLANEQDLSVGTLGGIKRTLTPVMKYAIDNNFIRENPLKGVELPNDKDEDGEEKPLFVEKDDLAYIKKELDRLNAEGLYIELRSILLTCVYTGMRISEVLGLRMGDIDFAKNVVHIRKQSKTYKMRDADGEITETSRGAGALKSEDSKRKIPISGLWQTVLEERILELKSSEKPELLKPDAYIFCNRQGGLRTYSGTRSIFLRFMKRIGFDQKGYTLHSFRHSFISHASAAGLDKDDVTKYVGHATSEITTKIYNHLTDEKKRRIAAGVDMAFAGL